MIARTIKGLIVKVEQIGECARVANEEGKVVDQQVYCKRSQIAVSLYDEGDIVILPVATHKDVECGQNVEIQIAITDGGE